MQVRELAPWQEGQPVVRFGCRTTELWALRIMVRRGGVNVEGKETQRGR